ncbi:MAG: hypothetical protein ABSB90_09325 [Thermoplasmata archaeon]|jgi:thymidylate kinase
MSGLLVAVDGPSASGKSRAVRAAALRLGADVLPEAYDRLRPRPSLSWDGIPQFLRLEGRLLREDARRFREGRARAAAGATVLADTGFLGPLTYTSGLVGLELVPRSALTDLVRTAHAWEREGRWGWPDAIIYLRTPAAERRRRAENDPRGHPRSLQVRHQQVAEIERRFYRAVVAAAYGDRFRFVAGSGTPDEVADRLVGAVARLPAPPRRPSYRRILFALDRTRGVP